MYQASIMKRKQSLNVCSLTITVLLAAVSYILAFIEISMPLLPSFARVDLSDFPALIGTFAFSLLVGVMIALIKNALQLLTALTGGVGELARKNGIYHRRRNNHR